MPQMQSEQETCVSNILGPSVNCTTNQNTLKKLKKKKKMNTLTLNLYMYPISCAGHSSKN